MRISLKFLALFAMLLAVCSAALAGTVSGVVTNGTNNAPVASADVILLQLQGGMEAVATTKADAQGRFQFDRPEIGVQPMLLRVQYRGVNYHQPVPPGTATANVTVFDNTQNAGAIEITSRAIVFQPNGQTLLIGEEYTVVNQTHPPVAYYRADGTFSFTLPDGAQLNQVSAWGSTGMPLTQGTIDRGKNESAIAFPFRPGENGVRISFQLPYATNEATIHTTSAFAAQRVLLVAPPTMQVLSAGFLPAGSEQGYNIYSRDNIPASTALVISVSGTAPPPSASNSDGGGATDAQNPSVNSRAGEGVEQTVEVLPGRLESVKWILVAGFASLFALGMIFLWKKPAQSSAVVSEPVPAAPKREKRPTVADVKGEVQGSLDQLKDDLFRLELRRQAGTISEEEYSRQRSRAEKVLRDLVRG